MAEPTSGAPGGRAPRTRPAKPSRPTAPPPLQARDKLAFLLSLVPWLMDRDGATVDEAAAHFGVTPDAIREAVELIAVSGIPGDHAAYQHGDLFDIDWEAFEEHGRIVLTNLVAIDDSPRFSAREAAALIAGLQYLSALPENADRAAIASLMAKLSRGSSGAPAPVAVAEQSTDATLAVIREAVERGLQVELGYLNSRGEYERRRVDPLRVESLDVDWYLRGWCHLRQAVRTFRLDRISDPVITDQPIEHRLGEVGLPERLFEPSDEDLEVELELAPAAVPLLADYLPGLPATASGAPVRTTVRVSHYHGLKRLVGANPGMLEVLGPPEARAAVHDWATAALARYDGHADGAAADPLG
ncbi:MAG: WYL domain-containing protein [Actinomycetales bacterium]|nr:WYL domain-containing protein [Actinomycetales bacterium]